MLYFKNPTVLKILDYYKNLWSLSYVSGVAHWDLETYMPAFGATARGEALGRISVIRQKMFLDKSFVRMLHATYNILPNLNEYEKEIVRVLKRSLDFYQKIPSGFLEEFEKLTNTGTVVWREAKDKNDFKIFEKDLQKIFDMNKKMAEYLGYENSPYDALLDLFEEGLTSDSVNQLFSNTKEPLQQLLKQITNSKKYQKRHWLENAKYDKEKLKVLNEKILKTLWKDYGKNFRLDTSSHPFTTSFSNQDTRITTWYHKKDFARSVLATIHEFGHALYDLQSDPQLEMTPIAGGSSLIIHESQSRFWENHVGRSKEFIIKFLPDFRVITNDQRLTASDIYMYFNQVKPSLLRVEADEVTYHFHIMLRFEIEKGIIEEKLKVKDLPEIWNAKMKEYLGVVPKNDSEGVLQDIHWSGGSVGYFPTYSLGTFLSAQWRDLILNSKLQITNYEQIKNLLREQIHKFGSTYTLGDLLNKNDMKFDPSVNIKYLEEKYRSFVN